MCSLIAQKTGIVKYAGRQGPRAPDAKTDLQNAPMESHFQLRSESLLQRITKLKLDDESGNDLRNAFIVQKAYSCCTVSFHEKQ